MELRDPMPASRQRASAWQTALAILLASLALSSGGCFEFIRSLRVGQICTPEAARAAGAADARAGDPPREDYGAICGVAEPSLNRIYRQAYDGGRGRNRDENAEQNSPAFQGSRG